MLLPEEIKEAMEEIVEVGDILQLVPRTRHAKNRVREHGCQVKVTIVKSDQFCCMHMDGEKENPDIWRWIAHNDDFDWDFVKWTTT